MEISHHKNLKDFLKKMSSKKIEITNDYELKDKFLIDVVKINQKKNDRFELLVEIYSKLNIDWVLEYEKTMADNVERFAPLHTKEFWSKVKSIFNDENGRSICPNIMKLNINEFFKEFSLTVYQDLNGGGSMLPHNFKILSAVTEINNKQFQNLFNPKIRINDDAFNHFYESVNSELDLMRKIEKIAKTFELLNREIRTIIINKEKDKLEDLATIESNIPNFLTNFNNFIESKDGKLLLEFDKYKKGRVLNTNNKEKEFNTLAIMYNNNLKSNELVDELLLAVKNDDGEKRILIEKEINKLYKENIDLFLSNVWFVTDEVRKMFQGEDVIQIRECILKLKFDEKTDFNDKTSLNKKKI